MRWFFCIYFLNENNIFIPTPYSIISLSYPLSFTHNRGLSNFFRTYFLRKRIIIIVIIIMFKFTAFLVKPLRIDLDYKRAFFIFPVSFKSLFKSFDWFRVNHFTGKVIPYFDWTIMKQICLYSSLAVVRKVAYKLECRRFGLSFRSIFDGKKAWS